VLGRQRYRAALPFSYNNARNDFSPELRLSATAKTADGHGIEAKNLLIRRKI